MIEVGPELAKLVRDVVIILAGAGVLSAFIVSAIGAWSMRRN